MPEAQTQDPPAQSSPDIASLAGTPPADDKSAIADLVKVQRAKTAADTAITTKADKQADEDAARVKRAFDAEGIGHDELKPWDADKEHRKFEHNPIEGFGSVGGLFAVIASAFTRAPMDNAINGMAGAINSIKAGDEASYERAYNSYKENTKLALDRHKIQHEAYSDALSLMDHDSAASVAKLRNAAVRFDDQHTLLLAEHGMIKELYELQASRAKAADQMLDLDEKTTKSTFQKAAVQAIKNAPPNTGDPVRDKMMLAAQIQRVYDPNSKYGSAEQEAVGAYMQKNFSKPASEIADGLSEIHQKFSPKAPNIEGYQNAKENWQSQHPNETMSADEDAKLLQQFGLTGRPGGAAGGHSESSQARKTRAIEEIIAKHEADGKPISKVDAEAEYNRRVSVPSPNRMDDLRGKIDQSDNIIEGSKKQLDFLKQYKGGAGLMGKIMRGEEIASNIVGAGTQSDRVAFRRRVLELQEIVPRIMTDSSGRPLASAQKKVDSIVAGLEAGDTSANTMRAYEDLIAEIEKRKQDYKGRIGSGYDPESKSSGAPAGAAESKAGNTDWLNAYPVKK